MHITKYEMEVLLMCGIAGYCNFKDNFNNQIQVHENIVSEMGHTLKHRGPDDFGTYVSEHVAFAHSRLAVIDLVGGVQPMKKVIDSYEYCIIYNGELYNTDELKNELLNNNFHFTTTSDTEVILLSYIAWGTKCVEKFNGIFSFAIWDGLKKSCFLCRDRFGVKPFFYSINDDCFVFASEIKALFKYPSIKPIINSYSLCEIFGLGPARSPGCGVFENIHEIPPGYAAYISYNGFKLYPYWKLTALPHNDSYDDTVLRTRELLLDAVERQLVSDVPICTLLSGGVDSSIISSIAANRLKSKNQILDTYSFDFKDNDLFFKPSSFQPSQDRPFVDIMTEYLHSNHTFLDCNSSDLFDYLYDAVKAKDLPGMADIDSSLLYFCKQIKKRHTVCLSGECADEVFGGYPWFRDEEAFNTRAFPWSKDLEIRKNIMSDDLLKALPLDEYVHSQYETTIASVPVLDCETPLQKRQREISYLNITWFMTTLLDRKDRTTMASGLEVRVPFADHRLVEYIYNTPWEFKYHNNTVKGLLRDAAKGLLPDEVLYRKKSPYPKTYNPVYENMLKSELNNIISNNNSPIMPLINVENIKKLMSGESDYGKPWFGQLMATPQIYAYLIQVNYWLELY